jgi:glycosyltransferase involved in cell wall biosynthesis
MNTRDASMKASRSQRQAQGRELDPPIHQAQAVCVVVPCFNEAAVVGQVIRALRVTFPHVVGVDDGSEDGSAAAMRSAGAIVIRHPVNLGQGAALQTGINFALSDPHVRFIVTFDADGQHRVEDAQRLVERATRGDVDVVLGSRFLKRTTRPPVMRAWLLRGAALFDRLTTGVRLTDSHNGLRVLTRHFAETLDLRLSGMAHASELLMHIRRVGARYIEYPVHVDYTPYSRSKGQSPLNAVNIALDVWLNKLISGGRS